MFNLSSRVSRWLFFTAAFSVAIIRPSWAQTPPPGRSAFGQPAGAGVFQRSCATCHTAQGVDLGGRVAPPVASLKAMAPEKIYAAMVNGGKMQAQASSLTDRDKRDLAEFLAGRRMADATSSNTQKMTNACASNPPLADRLDASPAWNGWGPDSNNARFQTAAMAGL